MDNCLAQDWKSLVLNEGLKNNLISEWVNLLNLGVIEHAYHKFISDHAGLLLANENCYLVVSKLKLGSDFETDFMTLTEGYSNGSKIELIEIKRPTDSLFTSEGIQSTQLNRAVQQVRNWKRWLIDNPPWVKKHLPMLNTRIIHNSSISFKIIIGRRNLKDEDIEKRNQIAMELGAEIRSFDYLTESLRKNFQLNRASLEDGNTIAEYDLANPFYKAFSDSEWTKFCRDNRPCATHFYSKYYKEILRLRSYNISI